MIILILFALNFAISWFNAWGCGRTWDATLAKGGLAHFMNWMGAIMSASGFTWCYLVVLGLVGSVVPITNEETGVSAPMLSPADVQAFFDLGYTVIIFPILGSGLAITVSSWRAFARRRSFGSGAVAGWNTFAQISNTYSAIRELPGVFDRLGGYFGGGSKSSKDGKAYVVILLLLAVLGGVLTTYGIIQAKRRAMLLDERLRVA